jgi:hypothetical protein
VKTPATPPRHNAKGGCLFTREERQVLQRDPQRASRTFQDRKNGSSFSKGNPSFSVLVGTQMYKFSKAIIKFCIFFA